MGLREQLTKAGETDFLGRDRAREVPVTEIPSAAKNKPDLAAIKRDIEQVVTKKRGRRKSVTGALTPAERQRRHRAAKRAGK